MLYYVYMWVDTLIISVAFTLPEQTTQSRSCIFVCARLLQILCVFDVAAVYLCGCVAIWAHRLFVLDRMDTGGEGPPALLLFV